MSSNQRKKQLFGELLMHLGIFERSFFFALALLILVVGTWDRSAAETESEQLVALLQESVKCPLSIREEEDIFSNIGGKKRVLDRYEYSGNSKTFEVIRRTTESLYFDDAVTQREHNVKKSITAPFAQLSRSEIKGLDVFAHCSGNHTCATGVEEVELCTVRGARREDCGKIYPPARKTPSLAIATCDADTARAVKIAVDRLIKLSAGQTAESAGRQCVVADNSGTPLNVRDAPFGKLTGITLQNGTNVAELSTSSDARGKPWSYIRFGVGSGPAGYVLSRLIDCS